MANLLDFYERFWNPSLYVLNAIERRGIYVSSGKLRFAEINARNDMNRALYELQMWAPSVENWKSYPQLQKFLYHDLGLTPPPIQGTLKAIKLNRSRKEVTSEAAIDYLAQGTPELRHLLEYRKAAKMLEFIEKLPGYCDEQHRIHSVLAPETDTGRLTSKNPNLQQIPKHGDKYNIRSAFQAAPGKTLIVADYSQLELYVLAHFCIKMFGDTSIADALESGDIHSWVARTAFKEDPKKQHNSGNTFRQLAKSVIYGINYGKQAPNLGAQLGVSTRDAQKILDSVTNALPGVGKFQAAQKAFAAKHGYVRTLLGRTRPIIGICSEERYEKGIAERQALNTPIQGSAADIVTAAMLRTNTDDIVGKPWFSEQLHARDCHAILQVHDELVFEVPEDKAEAAAGAVQYRMENPFPRMKMKVPLKVDVEIRNSWS